MRISTVYHSNQLTAVIDKYRLGKHKLVCTVNGNIKCTFLVVGYLENLIDLMKVLKKNKDKLVESVNKVKLGLDWHQESFKIGNVSFLLIGNFVNEKDNVNYLVEKILAILNLNVNN